MTDTGPPFQILIVDDESSLQEELTDFLTVHGMAVSAAGDGALALAALAADPAITVVLTDIRIPDLDGLGLGLPLANRAAERLDGRLEIESAPGAGTTARIAPPQRYGNGRAS
jgi:CheY-like chemotaxis protein